MHDAVAADRPVLALLQHAQQLGLQVGRHLADLVEQQRAALGHLEQPFLVDRRAGERALLVAEQLRLDQVLRDGRAVDLDERPFGPLAVVVDGVGDQLLAGAVLTLDEDVRFARRHALDELEEVLHLLALADDVLELVAILQLLLQLLVLVDQRLLLDRLLQLVEQALGVDRLLEKVEGAGLHRFDRPRNVALPGDDDDLGLGLELLELAHQFDAVDVRQHHVGDHGVRTPGAEEFLAARADECSPHLVASMLQQNLQPLGHRRLVVDGQDTLLALQAHDQRVPLTASQVNTETPLLHSFATSPRRRHVQGRMR